MEKTFLETIVNNFDKMEEFLPEAYRPILKYLKETQDTLSISTIKSLKYQLDNSLYDYSSFAKIIFNPDEIKIDNNYWLVPVDNLINRVIKFLINYDISHYQDEKKSCDNALNSVRLFKLIIDYICNYNCYICDGNLNIPGICGIDYNSNNNSDDYLRVVNIKNADLATFENSSYDSLSIVHVIENFLEDNPNATEINIALFGDFNDNINQEYHISKIPFKNSQGDKVNLKFTRFKKQILNNGEIVFYDDKSYNSVKGQFYTKEFQDALAANYNLAFYLNDNLVYDRMPDSDKRLTEYIKSALLPFEMNDSDIQIATGIIRYYTNACKEWDNEYNGHENNIPFEFHYSKRLKDKTIAPNNSYIFDNDRDTFMPIVSQDVDKDLLLRSDDYFDIDLFNFMYSYGILSFTKGCINCEEGNDEWDPSMDYDFIELVRNTKVRIDYEKLFKNKTVDFQFVFDLKADKKMIDKYYSFLRKYFEYVLKNKPIFVHSFIKQNINCIKGVFLLDCLVVAALHKGSYHIENDLTININDEYTVDNLKRTNNADLNLKNNKLLLTLNNAFTNRKLGDMRLLSVIEQIHRNLDLGKEFNEIIFNNLMNYYHQLEKDYSTGEKLVKKRK